MRDFNFFEVFDEGSQRSEGLKISFPVVLVILLLLAAAWPVYNFITLSQLRGSVDDHRQVLQSDPRYPLISTVEAKEAQKVEVNRQLEQMETAALAIEAREVINESLLYTIATAMPADTALSGMTITGPDIQLQGIARSKPAIAEFEFNVRETGYFEQLFIPNISETDDGWQFSFMFRVKGGDVQ
ncbi:PilN domain-containing protein [Anoxynatronum buryatiense]|uniref:Fimbrial assembly protein (PilN) n=1 Tax=Anoxynatronum buryatiense TaxID=489973 RepID=A0AA45WUZ8_9CLOT|nr:PilN domain-containing protein [Anoxynatronum buryatiense]SMP48773.1 Fimbrial assembly protein (PilN) [Anoxynatronum buryatiense]